MSCRIGVLFMVLGVALAACSSPADRAYKGCMARFDEANDKAKVTAPKDPTGKAMADAMLKMTDAMGEATCDAIRQNCKSDPNGQMCQAAVSEFSK